jgi:hypothetical protein
MTVDELRRILRGLPGDMDVMIDTQFMSRGNYPLSPCHVQIFPEDTLFICCLTDEVDEKELKRRIEHGNETANERSSDAD